MKMSIERKQQKKQPVQKVRTRVADGYAMLPVIDNTPVKEKPANNTFALHCDHVTTTWETITPAKAEKMLAANNLNRTVRNGVYNTYKSDMLADKWTLCTAPIVIYDNGNIADGQHRLWAVFDSGKTQKFLVMRGLRQPEGLNIDTGLSRNVVDAAKISGIDPHMSAKLHSAAKGIELGSGTHDRTSNSEKIRLVEKHRAAASFATAHVRGKFLANGAVYAAVGRAWYKVQDKAKLERFCEVLRNGHSNGTHESAAVTCRNYLMSTNSNLSSSALFADTMRRVQRAIKAFMSGRQLLRLDAQSQEEYPL